MTPFINIVSPGKSMAVNIPLDSMTVAEKLEALETIWASLYQTPANIQSPEWHKAVLAQRRQRLNNGVANRIDWAIAKKQLQNLGE